MLSQSFPGLPMIFTPIIVADQLVQFADQSFKVHARVEIRASGDFYATRPVPDQHRHFCRGGTHGIYCCNGALTACMGLKLRRRPCLPDCPQFGPGFVAGPAKHRVRLKPNGDCIGTIAPSRGSVLPGYNASPAAKPYKEHTD